MDAWIPCKDKVLIPGDVVRFQKKVWEKSRVKWKEIGLLEVTGTVDGIEDGLVALTEVEIIVLEDKAGGRKVLGKTDRRQVFRLDSMLKGRPRRQPWKDGEDVRDELVRERIAEVSIAVYEKHKDKVPPKG
jgi:hypothetical protein